MASPILLPDLGTAARVFFHHCDADGGGSISPLEFTRELKKQGKQWRKLIQARGGAGGHKRGLSWFDRPLAVYQAIDDDASGEIDEAEFVEYATTAGDERVIEMLLGPDGFAAWQQAQKEPVSVKKTTSSVYVAPAAQPRLDPVPEKDEKDGKEDEETLEVHVDANTGRRFSWNPVTEESNWLSSASDDDDDDDNDDENEEEEDGDKEEEILALKDQLAALKAHAAEADAKLKEMNEKQAAQGETTAARTKTRPPIPVLVGGATQPADPVQQQDLRQRLARSEAIALKWKQEVEEAHQVDRRKSYIYSPQTKKRGAKNTINLAHTGADMRQLQAMLTVLGEQVSELSKQKDTAADDSAANPYDPHKRIMLRQIELRYKEERRALRMLQEEIAAQRAYESNASCRAKVLGGSNAATTTKALTKRAKQQKKGAAKVTRSPRYRSPEIFHMKGATAAKKGVLYSNFNRTPRFKWQNRNDHPSPVKYDPNYEGTCQQTYLYRHDNEALNNTDSRRNQQVALLKARNRRGSTLGYFNEHKAQFPNSPHAQLQLEDGSDVGDEKPSRIQELEAALAAARRRESFVKADYVHRDRVETQEREQSELETAQLEHRHKTLARAAQKVLEAMDQYLADVLLQGGAEAANPRKLVMPDYRLIGPLYTMRMLVGSPAEPAHMTALREKVGREGGGHIHDRTVLDRIVVDPKMGVQHQYMGALAPSSSLLQQDEDLLPPPPPPPAPPNMMRLSSPPLGGASATAVAARCDADSNDGFNHKHNNNGDALPRSPSAAVTKSSSAKKDGMYSHSRVHSAVDVAHMPLPSAVRFLFMCYADAGTLSTSSWLRMLRDAMLFDNEFRFERIASLFNGAQPMTWADFDGAIRVLGNLKYGGGGGGGGGGEADMNAAKIKQRYLLPLAMSVSKDDGVVPHPAIRECINRIYNPDFMSFMSTGATAVRLKQLFMQTKECDYDQFTLLLKESSLVPRHLTGSDVAKIWRGVRSGKPRGGRTSYADTQNSLHQSVSSTMGSSAGGMDESVESVVRLDYPAFCEAMALASFLSFASSRSPDQSDTVIQRWDEEDPDDKLMKVLAEVPVSEESVVLDRLLSRIDENLLLDELEMAAAK